MKSFIEEPLTVFISGEELARVKTYLKIFLATKKLADKEISVTAELVCRYSAYLQDGLKEPYASNYLFSTDIRKEIGDALNMTGQHLSNTLITLAKKDIVATVNKSYILNPNLVPRNSLTFIFNGK